jgi:hypothetical protein
MVLGVMWVDANGAIYVGVSFGNFGDLGEFGDFAAN